MSSLLPLASVSLPSCHSLNVVPSILGCDASQQYLPPKIHTHTSPDATGSSLALDEISPLSCHLPLLEAADAQTAWEVNENANGPENVRENGTAQALYTNLEISFMAAPTSCSVSESAVEPAGLPRIAPFEVSDPGGTEFLLSDTHEPAQWQPQSQDWNTIEADRLAQAPDTLAGPTAQTLVSSEKCCQPCSCTQTATTLPSDSSSSPAPQQCPAAASYRHVNSTSDSASRGSQSKFTRSRKGCLTCRARKIKCSEDGAPCRECRLGRRIRPCVYPEPSPSPVNQSQRRAACAQKKTGDSQDYKRDSAQRKTTPRDGKAKKAGSSVTMDDGKSQDQEQDQSQKHSNTKHGADFPHKHVTSALLPPLDLILPKHPIQMEKHRGKRSLSTPFTSTSTPSEPTLSEPSSGSFLEFPWDSSWELDGNLEPLDSTSPSDADPLSDLSDLGLLGTSSDLDAATFVLQDIAGGDKMEGGELPSDSSWSTYMDFKDWPLIVSGE